MRDQFSLPGIVAAIGRYPLYTTIGVEGPVATTMRLLE